MLLSVQGSDLGFSLKHLKSAMEFNMSVQTVFKELKWCSASDQRVTTQPTGKS